MTPSKIKPRTIMSSFTTNFIPTTYITTTTITTTITATTTNSIELASTLSTNNMTNEDIRQHLEHLQGQDVKIYNPAVVFLVLTAVAGLVGNVLVLLVYMSKYTMTPKKIFIMAIALSDLITNILVIPARVYRIVDLWFYVWPTMCRLTGLTTAWTTVTSAVFLLVIAVDRFRQICKPFGTQITVKQAKVISISFVIFGCISSIPSYIFSGILTIKTELPGIHGQRCSIDDRYAGTKWPLVIYIFYLLLFVFVCVPMVVIYSLIGAQAYRHRRLHGMPKLPTGVSRQTKTNLTVQPQNEIPGSKNAKDSCIGGEETPRPCRKTTTQNVQLPSANNINDKKKKNPRSARKNSLRPLMTRTTLMLSLITVVFIVGYIPHPALVIFRLTQPKTYASMGNAALTIFNFLTEFFLINSAANPFIYSLCDVKFRQNVFRLFVCRKPKF